MPRDILIVLWRFVALWALLFWQGGFLFYTSIVVPRAQREITHFEQGQITRHVTVSLNIAGAVSLALLAVDVGLFPDPRPRRRWLLWSAWLGMALCQAALFALHPRLSALVGENGVEHGFYPLHRIYLWVHTVQWGFALAFTTLLLASWRMRDRKAGERIESGLQ